MEAIPARVPSPLRRFLGNLSVYTAARLVNRAVAFATIPVVAAYIGGVDAYGAKEYLEFLIVLAATLSRGEILQGLVRFLSGSAGRTEGPTLISTCACCLALSGALVAVPALLFPATISLWVLDDPGYATAIACAGLIVFFNGFFHLGLAVLEARQAAVPYVALALGKTLLEVVLKIVLLVPFGLGYLAIFFAALTGDLLFGLAALIYTARGDLALPEWSWARRLLAFSLPVMATNLCMLGVHQLDRVFLAEFTNLTEVGLYGIGWKFGAIVSVVLFASFGTAWFPAVFAIDEPGERQSFARRTSLLFIALAASLTLAAMMLAEVGTALLPADFGGALPIIRLVLFGYLFWFLYQIFSMPLFLHLRTRWVFGVALLGLVVNGLLNWWLVPAYGGVGAALATLLTYLLLAVGVDVVARRAEAMPYARFRLYAAVGSVGVVYLAWSGAAGAGLGLAGKAAAGALCWAGYAMGASILAEVPLQGIWQRHFANRRGRST